MTDVTLRRSRSVPASDATVAEAGEPRFAIEGREIGTAHAPYVIAEIGVNHDGDVARGRALVRAAHEAGAHAVKFQFFEADRLMSEDSRLARYQADAGERDPRDMLRAYETPVDAMSVMVRDARSLGMHPIVTVFSESLVAAAESFGVAAYKVASPDIIHRPLIEALLRTGRPVILSTGASDAAEIRRAAGWVGAGDAAARVAFLHCVSSYPTADADASLRGIMDLASWTCAVVGYSDHTTSIDTGGLAVVAGATLLEKHLTYDRTARGPDHAASLDPAQFAEYARLAARAHAMLGAGKAVLPAEADVRAVSRQSIVAARTLAAGTVLKADDLVVKRPGTGIPPFRMQALVGRTLRRTVQGNRVLHEEDLAEGGQT
jgi:N,N'-diacetyllegionaminate synthase